MDKTYKPRDIECHWSEIWGRNRWFAPHGDGQPFCILLPPPNVTGTLHMGHAFQQTLMDALVRYHRMRGERVLWQGGTDHAGIATQKIVENQLAAEGGTRQELGREEFIKRVWRWKEQSGATITHQMRRLGISIDWSRERFTMDAGLSAAVRRVFVDWYRSGLLYRGKRLVHWDPVLRTAVSDLEVDNEERDGQLWYIRYPATAGGEGLVVATTRPETMLGDVAVAVHPDDARYRSLIGNTLTLPLTGRQIPVIADAYVDAGFGTGAVKITPAHDFNDQAIGQRHQLPSVNIFTLDARINDSAPQAYRGLDRFAARKRILLDLETAGLLVKSEKHTLNVPISQRSDAVIEPMLTDQWFLDLTRTTRQDGKPGAGGRQAITEPALDAVRSGAIRFIPDTWNSTYTQWLENIQDWCVSRQLWWGHRIPAWYDESGMVFVGEDEADAIAHGDTRPIGQLRQDEDVLDTWFSAALWPFSTLGWPAKGPVKNDRGETVADWANDRVFLPSSVLVTGFDIIFFWVARMVMATRYFTGHVPFHEVYINAIVRDAAGQKMSKSKGNTIDPLDLMDGIGLDALVAKSTATLLVPKDRNKITRRLRQDYPQGIPAVGADALRFTFTALATPARTVNFDIRRCEGYRNFCTKLWNAARYVLMTTDGFSATGDPPLKTAAEHWIVHRLEQVTAHVEEYFRSYRFDLLTQELYEFTWSAFCDWFIELSKPALNGTDREVADSTRHTLLYVLEIILRALHPIVPFITEELWHQVAPMLGRPGHSISLQAYPDAGRRLADPDIATGDIVALIHIVGEIRKIRSEHDVPPVRAIPVILEPGAHDPRLLERIEPALAFLTRVSSIRRLQLGEAPPPAAATVTFHDAKLHIPFEGLIDSPAELARLSRQIDKLRQDHARATAKLSDAGFLSGAPAEVVAGVRARIAETQSVIQSLEQKVAHIRNVT